ncbi:UDP-N-acetylmuramoyl-L-alanyl-D-glutamate--2,6-diaminopimelate ligase [Ferroacidibacillus organovorans]|uniref:UDP-N-acetylmuramoyl-L-alanyl-D-glutamate--2,6-diaminopimelate ligase n=1 Tax=Ferroacidibacillus organovorans TaxID=1765683 RepID=A0A162ULI2_9BACL|nr:UDP-N-acetylmuramoyl-L-alanyl-D-glutamate--2,6-diaminopimelate ligase [Ferroacidibacillus organovorans]KYP81852.1 UDP-N-acetylmuramoyl-L-alanyl-D-glutamate--2,6-diaminopimelate ligase [Ferroacidibacillus organovorans]OAG94193.1 UDP-N-acetylmuramoyl-L-alanyl-D-glutamate--2,6-diaminopimelate ligase [Ferroacidibacillus organovorans]OPG16225.1 UDP-N-acetylmuramoyl-L-alanyl-D-glutamate--2,6-diaminopimelate ligase [Ferroacidibacillus organovorans]
MKQLRQLADRLVLVKTTGSLDVQISSIADDSRKVKPGGLFVAIRGNRVDGHAYAEQAVARGAVALLVEEACSVSVPQLVVPSTRRIAPIAAQWVLGDPADDMVMIAVTGTNGKTTTATLIEQILLAAGHPTGLIGTIAQRCSGGVVRESGMTTPEAVELANVLREMRDLGTRYVVMEASSHAMELARVAGLSYRVAAFTNLTQDHLDFHKTMDAYARAKGKLFSRLGNRFNTLADGGLPVAVLNVDDAQAITYAADTVQQVVTYGIDHPADVRGRDVVIRAEGTQFVIDSWAGSAEVHLATPGRFSAYNALCATASCLALGLSLQDIARTLSALPGVAGRFEPVRAGQPYAILVDYSHTPDSLQNALETIHEFCSGRVITVVGCGGDRDRTKRPIMARVAAQRSDFFVLTSDNPRTEDPEKILDDMEAGIRDVADERYARITLREEGIRAALREAKPGDVVLIAGKGHETYQILGTTYHDFDDRQVAKKIVEEQMR